MIKAEQGQQSELTAVQREQIARAVRFEIVRAHAAYRAERTIAAAVGDALGRAAKVLNSAAVMQHGFR